MLGNEKFKIDVEKTTNVKFTTIIQCQISNLSNVGCSISKIKMIKDEQRIEAVSLGQHYETQSIRDLYLRPYESISLKLQFKHKIENLKEFILQIISPIGNCEINIEL